MKTKVMQNSGRGKSANKVYYGRCANGKWVKYSWTKSSYFCLKQIEAVFLIKKIFLKELGELYLLLKRCKLVELILMNSYNSY